MKEAARRMRIMIEVAVESSGRAKEKTVGRKMKPKPHLTLDGHLNKNQMRSRQMQTLLGLPKPLKTRLNRRERQAVLLGLLTQILKSQLRKDLEGE